MIETEMQGLLIKAARHVGGQGLKLNNRFLVGVVDLLIKTPNFPAFWLEAKKIDLTKKTLDAGHVWTLDVTAKQKQFLGDWHAAGMKAGVASFVQIKGKGIKELHLCLYTWKDCLASDFMGNSIDHEWIGDHDTRLSEMADKLREFAGDK